MTRHFLFVYGLLKRGQKHHELLSSDRGCTFISEGLCRGFGLWVVKGEKSESKEEATIPMAMKNSHGTIFGELWVVSGEAMEKIDRLAVGFNRIQGEFQPDNGEMFHIMDKLQVEVHVWQSAFPSRDHRLIQTGRW